MNWPACKLQVYESVLIEYALSNGKMFSGLNAEIFSLYLQMDNFCQFDYILAYYKKCFLLKLSTVWNPFTSFKKNICQFKQNTSVTPISFEVQWNDDWTEKVPSFQLSFGF